jgi:DNA polymerase-4
MAQPALSTLHVDMDAFYASVEQRDRPELRGKPVIVGGIGNRGVVCAASYEARPFGVRSAMPIAAARRLCPEGIYLPIRMGHYASVSRQVNEILLRFTPLVEPLSLDEAFLDVHGCELLFGTAPAIARKIKDAIKAETGLTASAGVAPNKFLAKLASDHGKPDGLTVIEPDRVLEFLRPLAVGRLWGVGAKAEKRLGALGIHTIGQIAELPEEILTGHFGAMGSHLWRLSQGQDDRRVVPDRDAKSISTETTFGEDIGDREQLRACLLTLTDHLAARLRRCELHARTLEVKIRSSDFRTCHRAQALPEPSNITEVLWQVAKAIFERGLTDDLLPLRLLGVGASKLSSGTGTQPGLFDAPVRERQQSLDKAIDAIRGQFGSGALKRGSGMEHERGEGG